jgi:hypothetical protein
MSEADEERRRLHVEHEKAEQANRRAAIVREHAPALLGRLQARVRTDVDEFQQQFKDKHDEIAFAIEPAYGFTVRRTHFPSIMLRVQPVLNDLGTIHVEYTETENNEAAPKTEKHVMVIEGDSPASLSFVLPEMSDRYHDVGALSEFLIGGVLFPPGSR